MHILHVNRCEKWRRVVRTRRENYSEYTAIDYVGVRNYNKNNEFILRDITAICNKGKKSVSHFELISNLLSFFDTRTTSKRD